jgi:hypothetical protein
MRAARYILLFAGALLVAVALFFGGFVVTDFVWTHFVVTDPQQISLGNGVMVVGGGFLVGTTLGLLGLISGLYGYWPRQPGR